MVEFVPSNAAVYGPPLLSVVNFTVAVLASASPTVFITILNLTLVVLKTAPEEDRSVLANVTPLYVAHTESCLIIILPGS